MKRKAETDAVSDRPSKRLLPDAQVKQSFRADLFNPEILSKYTKDYSESAPYKHGVISDLISPSLLRSVRDEIRANISFSPKETDIYRIHQSGDLANLDGLDQESLKRLPSLVALRDALYSGPFRRYLADVTGAGALSGEKTDMAVNVYTPGCHLLCHDDVIGTRRVSYILYLTDPDKPWKAEWGGALRLYPIEQIPEIGKNGKDIVVSGPSSEFSVSIPPAFNQLSFFAVQPGESFHDVEEVYARLADDKEDDGGRVRMAISGWFHIPQKGEDGYVAGLEEELAKKSSLAQLEAKERKTGDAEGDSYDQPKRHWRAHDSSISAVNDEDDEMDLNEQDLEHLIKFMNPRYLTPDTVLELADTFSEESSLQLAHFLSDSFATSLRGVIGKVEASTDEVHKSAPWQCARPPHKHRFLYHDGLQKATDQKSASHGNGHTQSDSLETSLNMLINDLFASTSFHKWLSLATGLSLESCNVLARCFRRGLDYQLAQSYEEPDPRLELCLGLTPTPGWGADDLLNKDNNKDADGNTNGHNSSDKVPSKSPADSKDTQDIAIGGYEVYMAGDEDNDEEVELNPSTSNPTNAEAKPEASTSTTGAGNRRERADPAIYKSGDDGDDGVLFSMPACWNMLSIVLRDKGVLRFVKYVSRSARGNRWDVCAEWKVEPDSEADSDTSSETEDEDEDEGEGEGQGDGDGEVDGNGAEDEED